MYIQIKNYICADKNCLELRDKAQEAQGQRTQAAKQHNPATEHAQTKQGKGRKLVINNPVTQHREDGANKCHNRKIKAT